MGVVPDDDIWIVVVGFVTSFVLAFALGANDVANSFATSVGSKVLTMRQACILASIFEVAGAVLLGARVSDTIRKGIIDVSTYVGQDEILLVGMVASLTGACVWLLVATLIKLPVSGTHSIVGSTVGFALVAHGTKGINWTQIGLIAASWVISPLMSGIVSVLLFLVIRRFIINASDSLTAGLRFLPVFYGVTIVVNAFSIFYKGPEQLYLDRIPLWGSFVIAFGAGIITAIIVQFLFVPWQRKRISAELEAAEKERPAEGSVVGSQAITVDGEKRPIEMQTTNAKSVDNGDVDVEVATRKNSDTDSSDSDCSSKTTEVSDKPEVANLFSRLQILTAVFGSFAHGGNDVSNAIGPLVAVWLIATEGSVLQKAPTPIWVLFYGGAGIVVGLWVLGRRVIETMGKDLTKITPSSGFTIEIGAALTVLIASNIGIPISTTHCKVGSVVCVGRVRSRENVDWKIFRNIIIAWLVTLPASGLVSAGVFYGLQYLVPPLGPPWGTGSLTTHSPHNYTTVDVGNWTTSSFPMNSTTAITF